MQLSETLGINISTGSPTNSSRHIQTSFRFSCLRARFGRLGLQVASRAAQGQRNEQHMRSSSWLHGLSHAISVRLGNFSALRSSRNRREGKMLGWNCALEALLFPFLLERHSTYERERRI